MVVGKTVRQLNLLVAALENAHADKQDDNANDDNSNVNPKTQRGDACNRKRIHQKSFIE